MFHRHHSRGGRGFDEHAEHGGRGGHGPDFRRHARGVFGMMERHLERHMGRHGRHGGRHGRPLDHGDLRWLVLKLVADKPRHGYEVIKAIEETLGGMYSPSPGSVYPLLTMLEELGFVSATAEGSKKLYTLTEDGRVHLGENQATVDAVFARLEAARASYGGGPAPEVLRAMQNLRAALQVRLGKGPLSPEEVSAVTAILDRAAGEVERS